MSSPDRVIALAKKATDDGLCVIHTFGIGKDCSKNLVESVARVGRGICSLVVDNKDIRSVVIQALARA